MAYIYSSHYRDSKMKKGLHIKFEYRISLIYLVLGALWILFSDKLLNILISDLELRASVQLYKGWFYVLLTAIFFFIFIKRYVQQLRNSRQSLSEKNIELRTIHEELENKNRELDRAREKAEESNRLKTAFLNNISHEIRTPMNSILGFSGMLTRSNITDKQRATFASYIDLSTNQLLNMITDVIEISQIQLGEIQIHETVCDIDDILDKIEQKAAKKITEKNIIFKIDRHINDKMILMDSYKFNRVLEHLIDNAIKFTKKGSVNLKMQQQQKHLEIIVSDTGIGIPEDIKEKIFDAFRQEELGLTRNYGGSGLGLALVKAYIDLMDGSLDIKSTKDVGTQISLSIPYHIPRGKIESDDLRDKKDLSDKTILIADDEIFNYYYLKEVLDHLNINSLYASTGKEALDLFRESPHIDLILMDIKMPIMDGFEATRMIREDHKTLPIIAQSAYVLEKEELSKHFTDILPKPILREELKKIIHKYLN